MDRATAVEGVGDSADPRSLQAAQDRILRMIHEDRPLAETLTAICRMIEAQVEGMLTSILLLDAEGQHLIHGAAPTLSRAWCEAIDGISIGPTVGACGAAAFLRAPCIVEDVLVHPNCAAFRNLAVETAGIRAIWSTPIFGHDGAVVATFAMYYRTPRLPNLAERKLIDNTCHLVTIAVNRHRDGASLGEAR